MLTDAEQQQLLTEWNNTQAEHLLNQTLPELIELQVERTPNEIALVFESKQLTYHQLNQQANQLAHYLQSVGVGPEILVGICVERSIEMVVGLLAILKAGGAYVPLDPTYPSERLQYMLNDAQVTVLLTQQQLTQQLTEQLSDRAFRCICLDALPKTVAEQSTDNPDHGLTPQNLAYVIYTSGSTGQPKGAMNTQQGICNRLLWMQERYGLTVEDRVLQKTPFSFDVSVWEFFWPLLAGAVLVVAKPEGHKDVTYLIDLIRQQGITTLHFVPSMLQVFLKDAQSTNCKRLKRVICSGEALPYDLQVRFFERLQCELHNLYGPTEAAIDVTAWQCEPTSPSGMVPIGRPIANTQLYVLDAGQQPVAIGIVGELYIGGYGLARGYLNRPELTAKKFIANPFGDGRLYKTGDLVRYLADGKLEFLGRIDHQVKLRGFRIELGEIEAALSRQTTVQQCVVVMREETPGNQRLVAYVVIDSSSHDDAGADYKKDTSVDIRNKLDIEALKQQLPDYMVPSAFISLAALPLTPNGKINRKALPAPNDSLQQNSEYVAPQSDRQWLIARQIANVLSLPVEKISIDENFFELGGHSLLATQLNAQLQEIFSVRLPLRTLFESPTVAALDKALDKVLHAASSPSSLSSTQQNNIPKIVALPADKRLGGDLPLSFAQERLWFLSHLEGTTATYNMPAAVRITGDFDSLAMQQAISALVARHESLRTCFPTVNGKAVQQIEPTPSVELETVILQSLDIPLEQWLEQQAQQPFVLETGPLLRVKLVQIDATERVLSVVMHHIISDGWSIGIFIRELATLYRNYRLGTPYSLPPLPIQYADYSQWQRQWLQGEVLEKQLHYWQKTLSGAPAQLKLPTDFPRPSVQRFQGQTHRVSLSPELTASVKALSQQYKSTLFMVLLASFQLLLSRYSGQTDIVVGTPIANRQHAELEDVIGLFVNTLVLRHTWDETTSLSDFLHRVRHDTVDAYSHQDLPFEQLVEALQPERSLSYSPIFQVMFVMQNAPPSELALEGLTLTPLETGTTVTKFDLTLSVEETAAGLATSWEYDSSLFTPATIERMASHFERLLQAMTAAENHVSQPVTQLPMLSDMDRQQLLVAWNNTQLVYPKHLCIHQLFEQQVKQTPDALALVFENQQLTYRELNQRANQLAHYLQRLGVGAEVKVGLCVERSVDMVVGLLATLKAGGAYIPLDPSHPASRIQCVLEDAQITVLITQSHLVEQLQAQNLQTQARQTQNQTGNIQPQSLVCLDRDWPEISQSAQDNISAQVTPHNLAYVIYTSGSTGKPKGVMIEHRSVVNFLSGLQASLKLSPADRLAAVTTIAFDIAGLELFLPLTVGAQVQLIAKSVTQDGYQLREQLEAANITVMQATPATWQMLLAAGWNHDSAPITVLCGGEALPAQLAYQLTDRGHTLWNLYGPTETTIWSTQLQVQANVTEMDNAEAQESVVSPISMSPISIGHPIANTQVYVLDSLRQPLPVGAVGELYIGGDGLARGYLNRPELTAKKFIANPFGDGRLYKTGDLVRYLADSKLEFLGRIDHQVKLRGFRIELGEIEAALNQQPGVEQCIVTAREDHPGNTHLIAYVVSAAPISNLHQALKAILPAYMLPSAIVSLPEFPLTPNGKVNRKALPAPDGSYMQTASETVLPRNSLEQTLVEIWSEALHLESPIGVTDNFFDRGGHSLLAMQLVSGIEQKLGVRLSVATLFQHPTVETFATALWERLSSQEWSPLVPMNASSMNEPTNTPQAPFFCFPGAGGNPTYLEGLANHINQDRPFYALQSPGVDERTTLLTTVEEAAAYYIKAIQSIQPQGPYYLGGHSIGGTLAFEVALQLQQKGHEVALLAMLDAFAPKQSTVAQLEIERPATEQPAQRKQLTDAEAMYKLCQIMEDIYGINLNLSLETLSTLTSDEQIQHFHRHLQSEMLLSPGFNTDYLNRFRQLYRTETEMVEVYQPASLYQGQITCFVASDRSLPQALDTTIHAPSDSSTSTDNQKMNDTDGDVLGWQRFSNHPISSYQVPGEHITLLIEPHVRLLAKELNHALAEARRSWGGS
ncbi:MAG: amino acid adenylation domain-containing protein [Cyanobacteria bacterium P01_F01_bin.3]